MAIMKPKKKRRERDSQADHMILRRALHITAITSQ
jgi:hypothetical protein